VTAGAPAPSPARAVLGIDLGGTKIEGAVLLLGDGAPRTLARRRIPTLRDEGYEAILVRLTLFVHELVTEAALPGVPPVGIGMPGSVSRRTGLVKNSNTLCLNGRPFRQDLAAALGVELRFANDANCFALAESRLGAARAHASGVVFGVILGTGVGGGLVLRGEVWDGLQGIAGEWGHHTLFPGGRPCYCGRAGCVERYLAGPDVERQYRERAGAKLALPEIIARREQDPAASDVISEMLTAFGRGIGNVISILDPDVVVLGGGVSNASVFYDEGVERVRQNVFNDELSTPILRAELGDAAGVLGAALLVA
jgi:fructokinase